MKAALTWLKDYWYIPFVVLAAVLAWVLTRKRPPVAAIAHELEAIAAGSKARKEAEVKGAEVALEALAAEHAATVAKLNDDQRAQAEELRADPAALARFLVKAAR